MCIMDLSLNEENLTQILNKLSEDEVFLNLIFLFYIFKN